MTWKMRPKEDVDKYKPYECPGYAIVSNKDKDDDDLLFDLNVDKNVYEQFQCHDEEEMQGEKDDQVETDEDSVYAGSDEERMVSNSSDDEESNFPVFNEEVDMRKPCFELGMLFTSSGVFRKAVKQHAIMERRPIENVRNYGKKVKFICEAPCKWKVYASPFNKTMTYQIRTLINSHTCMLTFNQKQINSAWLAEHYEKEIRMNPGWPIHAFHQKIFSDLKCNVSKHAVYRAKKRALIKINGTHEIQFGQVWDYAYELKRVLPDSTVKILTEDPLPGTDRGRFSRMYVCLGPVKKAFVQFCRNLVGLDGCHLKGPFGGQLLAAVGVDANEGMYPIAWAVVESETNDSWTWFLQYLGTNKRTCTCRKWELTGIPCYHAVACISIRNDPWEKHVDTCYTKEMYMKLYNCTLEPIAGPEFWQPTQEPRPLPPNVKTPAGRPKKKRCTTNDIPKDPTKLSKVGIINNCTYCKAQGHNSRTCDAKKNDLIKKAAEEGTLPNIKRSTCVCKTCNKEGHNSRTCPVKKQQQFVAQEQNQQITLK